MNRRLGDHEKRSCACLSRARPVGDAREKVTLTREIALLVADAEFELERAAAVLNECGAASCRW